jgi:hypothetical protein
LSNNIAISDPNEADAANVSETNSDADGVQCWAHIPASSCVPGNCLGSLAPASGLVLGDADGITMSALAPEADAAGPVLETKLQSSTGNFSNSDSKAVQCRVLAPSSCKPLQRAGSSAPALGHLQEDVRTDSALAAAAETAGNFHVASLGHSRVNNHEQQPDSNNTINILDDPDAQDPFEQEEPSQLFPSLEFDYHGMEVSSGSGPYGGLCGGLVGRGSNSSGSWNNFKGIQEINEGVVQLRAAHPYYDKACLSAGFAASAGLSVVPAEGAAADRAAVIYLDAPTVIPNSKGCQGIQFCKKTSHLRCAYQ